MTEALKAVVVNKYSLCPIFETLCVPLGNDQPVSVCHHNKQVRCCFGPPDKRRPSRRAGECAFKCFLTWWRSIMAKLWKSPRRPASAYAHYLWEHAGSWLPFTKAGTQGQREWEWKVCVCACVRVHPLMKRCLCCVSMGDFWGLGYLATATLSVHACLLAYSVSCFLRLHTLIASYKWMVMFFPYFLL